MRPGGDASPGSQKQDQPLDLLAGDAAFMWQARDEQVKRFGREGQALGGQGFAGKAGDVAGLVLVTGDGGAGAGLFGGPPQARIPAEVTRLDEQEGLRIEPTLHMGRQCFDCGAFGPYAGAGELEAD